MLRKPLNLVLVFCSFLMAGGLMSCGASLIRVPVTRPAEVNTAQYKKVIVGEVTGRYYGVDTAALESQITQALVECHRFEVIDKRAAARVLEENNAASFNLLSREAGKYFPNAFVISGHIIRNEVQSNVEKGDSWNDKSGHHHQLYYRTTTVHFQVNFELTDMADGRVFAVKTVDHDTVAKNNQEDGYPRVDGADLSRTCQQRAMIDFLHKIVPYQDFVNVALLTDGDLPHLERGNGFAKNGFWTDAATEYQSQIKETPTQENIHKAYYLLGLSQMYTNNFADARVNFKTALASDPDNYYYKHAYADVDRLEQEREELQKQNNQSEGTTK